MIFEFTQDIPPSVEKTVTDGFAEIGAVGASEHMLMRADAPPSWVAIIAEHKELLTVLGPSAALFLAEIVKEAAKDTWRNKAAIVRALGSAASWPLRRASEVLWRAFEDAPRHPSIVLGLSVAKYTSAKCILATTDEETLAVDLALFVLVAPRLAEVLTEIEESVDRGIGDYVIELNGDGTATITWMAMESLEPMTRTIGERVV